jgi:hypothetical protein
MGMKKLATLAIVLSISAVGLNSVHAGQPHMDRALEHLRAARAELQSAEHNKGGWRVRALANVDRAIRETENGIAAGAGR